MISLYTTVFNIEKLDVDFDEVFSNWLYYVDEIVIATFKWEHGKVRDRIAKSKFYDSKKIGVVSKHVEIKTDVYWEGKLKNAALEACKNDIALQCDLDERISGDPKTLKYIGKEILKHDSPCSVMLSTLDLYEDLDHYINIGYKWYLHKRQGTFRGSVNFAKKEDGTLDHKKSDTCELISSNGDLIPCIGKIAYSPQHPKIIHLGYLDLKERNKVNEFWGKIWNHRQTGEFNDAYEPEKVESGDSRKKIHNLPHPLWPKIQ